MSEINFIKTTFRNMTHGYYVNIGSEDDTDSLAKMYNWDGISTLELKKPLHDFFEENRCPTLLHFVTIGVPVERSLFEEFHKKIYEVNGWKRRILYLKVPKDELLKTWLTQNFYTSIDMSDIKYDHFIHQTWDVLI